MLKSGIVVLLLKTASAKTSGRKRTISKCVIILLVLLIIICESKWLLIRSCVNIDSNPIPGILSYDFVVQSKPDVILQYVLFYLISGYKIRTPLRSHNGCLMEGICVSWARLCLFTSTVSIREREGHSICHGLSTDKFPPVLMVSLWLPAIALANKIGACSFNASLPVACCPSSGRLDSLGQKLSAPHEKC